MKVKVLKQFTDRVTYKTVKVDEVIELTPSRYLQILETQERLGVKFVEEIKEESKVKEKTETKEKSKKTKRG